MYKDINSSAEALMKLEEALSNGRVSRENIENLSAGLQNDNIEINEAIEKNFNPNKYSNSPSNISLYEAQEVAEEAKYKLSSIADANKIEAFKAAISSITYLHTRISHLVKTKNPNMDTFENIKKYYSRPKKEYVLKGNSYVEEIVSEFIPLSLSNNIDQTSFLRSISDTCQACREAFKKAIECDVQFYPMLNWISSIMKDSRLTSGEDFANWEMLFSSTYASSINVVELSEAIIDGRLLNVIELTKKALEQELAYSLLWKVDALKDLTIAKDDIVNIKLDPIKYTGALDRMYKDKASTNILELLFYSIYSLNKEI